MRRGHWPDESCSTGDSCRRCGVTPQKEFLYMYTGQCSCWRMLTMGLKDATVCDRQPTLCWCDMGHFGCMGCLVANWTFHRVMAWRRSLGKPDASETIEGWDSTGSRISWGTCVPQGGPEVHSEGLSHDGILGERMHLLVLSCHTYWWKLLYSSWKTCTSQIHQSF